MYFKDIVVVFKKMNFKYILLNSEDIFGFKVCFKMYFGI